MSNWYTALVLAKMHPNLKINFYLSEPFREKFKKIEPRFDLRRMTKDMPQQIDYINVFSIAPKRFKSGNVQPVSEKAFEARIQKWIPQWLDLEGNHQHVCTLAFTTRLIDIIRNKQLDERFETRTRAAGYFVMQGMKTKLENYTRTKSRAQIAPLITFRYFQSVGPLRYFNTQNIANIEGAIDLFSTEKRPGLPVYGLPASFVNGAMFLSKQKDILDIPAYSVDVDYLGYAYAANPASVRRYLSLVKQFARDNPFAEKILVIIPSHHSLFNNQLSEAPMNIIPNATVLTWDGRYNERRGLQYTNPPYSNGIVYQYSDQDLAHLYLLHFPSGISFKDVTALMKAANLPVLVTGTLSLSQALQYDRAVIYEALPHHSGLLPPGPSFAHEIEKTLTGRLYTVQRRKGGDKSASFLRRYKTIFLSEKVPPLNEPALNRKRREKQEIIDAQVNDSLFDVTNGQRRVPTESNRRQFYYSFLKDNRTLLQAATKKYRKTLDGGFILDKVLNYCDSARTQFAGIRKRERRKKVIPIEEMPNFLCQFERQISGLIPEYCVGVRTPK